MTTQEQMNQSVMGTYGRFPVVIDHGAGESCADETGKQYIDFGSGIGTTSLGYCNEAWTEAVCKQVKTMQHTSNLYYTKVQADFAQKLCQTAGYEKVFFCNSGAEANECAIKLARKYSFDKYGKGRHKILTLVNSFHGRTLCTLSATGQDVFHNYFFPFVEGFDYVTANDIADLESKLDDTVCAVMLEYIQGEGGVNALEQAFVDAVFEKCAAKDVLVIADEVQTGVGRTGTFLAGEQFGHKADVTTLAKGIAGGLPMGACLANEKCAGVLDKGFSRLYIRRQSGMLCRRSGSAEHHYRRRLSGRSAAESQAAAGEAGKAGRRGERQRSGTDDWHCPQGQESHRCGKCGSGKGPAGADGKDQGASAAAADHYRRGNRKGRCHSGGRSVEIKETLHKARLTALHAI